MENIKSFLVGFLVMATAVIIAIIGTDIIPSIMVIKILLVLLFVEFCIGLGYVIRIMMRK